ncbi:MAG: hypothetical protein M1815_000424 [Lichina confinis]|nr:MAG: hypothetical protein M1815_000424 [Lichina confinis]
MAAMSSFLWEDSGSPPVSATRQSHQSLPSLQDLAQGVPASGRPEDGPPYQRHDLVRDSGNWSMPSQSKHSSTASFATNAIQLPALNSNRTSPRDRSSGLSTDRSPHSSTTLYSPLGPRSSEEPPSRLSLINQPFDPVQVPAPPPAQAPTSTNRESADLANPPLPRPSSVNSRMHHLALTSPLASNNASQTSLVTGLQRERGIPSEAVGANGVHPVFSQPGSASGSTLTASTVSTTTTTTSLGRRVPGRTAPPIGVNGQSQWQNPNSEAPTKGLPWAFPDPDHGPNPNAMKPTKGMPWAFPDPELAARPSSKSDADKHSQPPSVRRDSIGAASVASSLYTTDSRMVAGSRRPDDDVVVVVGGRHDGSRPILDHDGDSSTDLGGFGGPHHHHHHQLQHRQLPNLGSEPTSPAGNTPYSRTPELRVSHKLAERKRRSEMKNLFEELRMILPSDGRVSKSSKWEILTKAIDYTRNLEQSRRAAERKADSYRSDVERCAALQRENQELRDEVHRLRQHGQQNASVPNVSLHYHPPPPQRPSSPPSSRQGLPMPAPSSAMQGIQFSG